MPEPLLEPIVEPDADAARRAGLLQFVRYVVVGVVNTAFSYGIYALFVYLGFAYAVANLFSLVIGILFSFKMQGRFVFANTDNRRIVRFGITWAVLYGVNVGLIALFVRAGFNAYISGALALPPTVVLSYLAQKFFVFRADPAVDA